MATKLYDANKVAVTFAGRPIAFGPGSGLADGEFVKVEYNEDAYTLVIGSDGEGTRSKSNNRSARITVSLAQTSDGNNVLSALHNLDLRSANGALGAFLLEDTNGLTLFTAPDAWIVKFADSAYDRQSGRREWTIECTELEGFVGGS